MAGNQNARKSDPKCVKFSTTATKQQGRDWLESVDQSPFQTSSEWLANAADEQVKRQRGTHGRR